jgi:hypothetical protein
MDFTKVRCMSSECKGTDTIMGGAGGSFGGRINIAKLKCPVCGTVIMIIPMKEEFEYSVSATTEQERKQKRIDKAREESALKLAETINRIEKTGY